MTIQHIDSFNLAGTNADLLAAGYNYAEGSVEAAGGRFGDNGYLLDGISSFTLGKNFTFAAYITLSFWYYQAAATLTFAEIVNIGDTISSGYLGTNIQVGVAVQADGAIQLDGDGGGVKGISGTGVIQAQTWHHIELSAYLNSAGSASLYVDGIQVVDVPSGDFFEGNARNFLMFTGQTSGNTFDHIVFQDDVSARPALLGEHKIHTLLPSADTAQADWTGAYTDIDDPIGSSDGDTTYISATTLNDKSEFDLTNLTESPTTIYAVKSTVEARKTDAGTIGVTHHIDSNGTEEAGTEFAASETYGYHSEIHELNPDGSVAWTETSINALKVGVEITT